ncbi:hypothetical protein LJE86_15130 [bacterium BMS3Abin03]|jgi:hypothetical protein|nr:hypothetical protein [bacterium BMS3Abin03]MCG6958531.1 hypothetical protein [bacterium BMS3Abin03]
MKTVSIPIKITLIVFLLTSFSFAQMRVGAGGFLGGGTIKGQSLSIGTFTASAFLETNTVLFLEVTPRLSIIYARDFDAILPNTRKPYYPYLWGISLKGITTQYFENHIFLEEGFGLLTLNDRTFSDTNSWSYGVVLSLSGGWDLRGFNLEGFKVGAGIEYGITFNNTLAQYSSFHFYLNYSI